MSFDGINDLMLGVRAILNVGANADYNGIYLTEPVRSPPHSRLAPPWTNVLTARMAKRRHRRGEEFVDP